MALFKEKARPLGNVETEQALGSNSENIENGCENQIGKLVIANEALMNLVTARD